MTDRELMQQALEALERARRELRVVWTTTTPEIIDAITALRSALAEPDYWQEEARRYAGNADYWRKRYETLAEPQQHPVAWRTFDGEGGYDYRSYENNEDYHQEYVKRNGTKYAHWVEPLYTTPPPQRKPLPASEIVTMYDESPSGDSDMIAFARAIERAHGIGT